MSAKDFLLRDGPIYTIVLADDDARFRTYLRTLLAKESSVEVVGEAQDGETALEMVEAHDPELLLVDLVMPGLNGVETMRRALSKRPCLNVMVISLHNDRRMVSAALEAGASGYLLKDRLGDQLSHALAAVMHGGTYLSVELSGV